MSRNFLESGLYFQNRFEISIFSFKPYRVVMGDTFVLYEVTTTNANEGTWTKVWKWGSGDGCNGGCEGVLEHWRIHVPATTLWVVSHEKNEIFSKHQHESLAYRSWQSILRPELVS